MFVPHIIHIFVVLFEFLQCCRHILNLLKKVEEVK